MSERSSSHSSNHSNNSLNQSIHSQIQSTYSSTHSIHSPTHSIHSPTHSIHSPTQTTPLKTLFLHSLCRAQSVIIARMRKDQKQQVTLQLKEYGKQVPLVPFSPLEQPIHPRPLRGRWGERHRNDPRKRHRRGYQGKRGTPGIQQL